MDERDASRNGHNVVRRQMAFIESFVTCSNCACNYNASAPSESTFCQMFSKAVNPDDVEQNEATARACAQWIPNGLSRHKTVTPNHRYWYEDKSDSDTDGGGPCDECAGTGKCGPDENPSEMDCEVCHGKGSLSAQA